MSVTNMAGAGAVPGSADRVLDRDALAQACAQLREQGKRVGFTNGCFDILHVGHLAVLDFARAQCDVLVVGVNSDASVKRLKGPTRPVNGEADRALLLAGLRSVDWVGIFKEDTPLSLIEAVLPDVLVKGADYAVGQIVGAELVQARGGQVITCSLVPGRSTTRIVEFLHRPAA